jgi:hypothetical protein
VPPGTRSIDVVMTATRASGTSNDGYFDNLELSIDVTLPRVRVAKSGLGDGLVSGNGISCGTAAGCVREAVAGTSLTFVATPHVGARFVRWDGCTSVSGPSCTVTAPATGERVVTATFEQAPVGSVRIDVARRGTGSGTVTSVDGAIDCGDACANVYPVGSTIELTAAAAPGSAFLGWAGCTTFGGPTCWVAVRDAATVTATFAQPSVVFAEGFEDAGGLGDQWRTGGTTAWGVTTAASASGTASAADSPAGGYANGAATWLETTVDLSEWAGCTLEYQLRIDAEKDDDLLAVEAESPGLTRRLRTHTGSTHGAFVHQAVALTDVEGAAVTLRLELTADDSVVVDGVYVDDLSVVCLERYELVFSGTFTTAASEAWLLSGQAGVATDDTLRLSSAGSPATLSVASAELRAPLALTSRCRVAVVAGVASAGVAGFGGGGGLTLTLDDVSVGSMTDSSVTVQRTFLVPAVLDGWAARLRLVAGPAPFGTLGQLASVWSALAEVRTVTVRCAAPADLVDVTLTLAGAPGGRVTSVPVGRIDCEVGATCTAAFPRGALVDLRGSDVTFAGPCTSGTQNRCSFVAAEPVSLSAVHEPASPSTGGTSGGAVAPGRLRGDSLRSLPPVTAAAALAAATPADAAAALAELAPEAALRIAASAPCCSAALAAMPPAAANRILGADAQLGATVAARDLAPAQALRIMSIGPCCGAVLAAMPPPAALRILGADPRAGAAVVARDLPGAAALRIMGAEPQTAAPVLAAMPPRAALTVLAAALPSRTLQAAVPRTTLHLRALVRALRARVVFTAVGSRPQVGARVLSLLEPRQAMRVLASTSPYSPRLKKLVVLLPRATRAKAFATNPRRARAILAALPRPPRSGR